MLNIVRDVKADIANNAVFFIGTSIFITYVLTIVTHMLIIVTSLLHINNNTKNSVNEPVINGCLYR